MEKKIRETIQRIMKTYGADKGAESILRREHILNLCMNDMACHPGIEKELSSDDAVKRFVMQTILNDVSMEKVDRFA